MLACVQFGCNKKQTKGITITEIGTKPPLGDHPNEHQRLKCGNRMTIYSFSSQPNIYNQKQCKY
jgi:hypothetical protein